MVSAVQWAVGVKFLSLNRHRTEVFFLFFPSACPYSRVEPYQPKPFWYSGVLAASPCQAKSWTCLCLPPVFPHCFWWTGELGRAAWKRCKLHSLPASGPAAWHHLSAAYWGVHPRGLEPAISLELAPHTQNHQGHRWGHTHVMMLFNKKGELDINL